MIEAGHKFVRFAPFVLVACGTSPAIGTSRIADDASVSTGGKPSSTESGDARTSAGGGSTTRDADTPTRDARATMTDGGFCVTESVSHVFQSATLAAEAPAGTGGTPPASGADAGRRLPGLPTAPCGVHGVLDCLTPPRAIFGCPSVSGPSGAGTIHPGERIVVTVPITDEGLAAYSCEGLVADQPLTLASVLVYAVKPGYVQLSGELPSDMKPGTVIHFSAEASGTAHASGTLAACSNDLTRMDFDVKVE